jgi:predicted Fe-Mo cluster-binding NifX family protein
MKVCIPVTHNDGLKSPVCAHFGAAPVFLVVDTESGDCRAIANRNQHHAHGMCQPLAVLAGEAMDAIAVGGIGMGALSKLQDAGLRVYLAEQPTVEATVAALKSGALPEVDPARACGHHGQGHGHGQPDHEH